MRGVEPLSESIVMQLSPSACLIFYFPTSSPKAGLISRYLDEFPISTSENWCLGILLLSSHLLTQDKSKETLAFKLLKRKNRLRL